MMVSKNKYLNRTSPPVPFSNVACVSLVYDNAFFSKALPALPHHVLAAGSTIHCAFTWFGQAGAAAAANANDDANGHVIRLLLQGAVVSLRGTHTVNVLIQLGRLMKVLCERLVTIIGG